MDLELEDQILLYSFSPFFSRLDPIGSFPDLPSHVIMQESM